MFDRKKRLCLIAGLLFSLELTAKPEVLATIKPLQLIAQAVVGEEIEVGVLLPPGATPHHYSMRPSDMLKLNRADIVIWLGERSEHYLAKPMRKVGADKQVLNLEPYLELGKDNYLDPHLWLSAKKALKIARALTDQLIALDSGGAERYRNNLAVFIAQVEAFEEQLKADLEQLEIRYLVYHDAYGYFERAYGLSPLEVVASNPEVNPGARHLLKLARMVASEKIQCILIEPESNPAMLNILTKGSGVKQLLLDPMANDITYREGYIGFLKRVADTFRRCQL